MPTCVRASAETMPCVTVCPTPKGSPMASTMSPTSSASELANSSTGKRSCASLMRSTARSLRLSLSTISASNSRLSASATLTSSAPSMTCTLVTIRPLGSTITPEPSERWICAAAVARHAEEAAEDRVVEQRVAGLDDLGGVDIDHRRGHPLHHRRIGQPQFGGIRHPALLSGSDGDAGQGDGGEQDGSQGSFQTHVGDSRRDAEI